MEAAGFEVRDVEALREHYARTLRAWVANLEAGWDEAVRLGTPVLVVQASHDSRPILDRLGFRTVGPVRTFIDHF